MVGLHQCGDRIQALLTNAVIQICQSEVNCENKLRLQGLLGITADDKTVYLVQMNEQVLLNAFIDNCGDSCDASQVCMSTGTDERTCARRQDMPLLDHNPAGELEDRCNNTPSSAAIASNMHAHVTSGVELGGLSNCGNGIDVLTSIVKSELLDTWSQTSIEIPCDDQLISNKSNPADCNCGQSSDQENLSDRLAAGSVDNCEVLTTSQNRNCTSRQDEKLPDDSTRCSSSYFRAEETMLHDMMESEINYGSKQQQQQFSTIKTSSTKKKKQCRICKSLFSQASLLMKHLTEVHGRKRGRKCKLEVAEPGQAVNEDLNACVIGSCSPTSSFVELPGHQRIQQQGGSRCRKAALSRRKADDRVTVQMSGSSFVEEAAADVMVSSMAHICSACGDAFDSSQLLAGHQCPLRMFQQPDPFVNQSVETINTTQFGADDNVTSAESTLIETRGSSSSTMSPTYKWVSLDENTEIALELNNEAPAYYCSSSTDLWFQSQSSTHWNGRPNEVMSSEEHLAPAAQSVESSFVTDGSLTMSGSAPCSRGVRSAFSATAELKNRSGSACSSSDRADARKKTALGNTSFTKLSSRCLKCNLCSQPATFYSIVQLSYHQRREHGCPIYWKEDGWSGKSKVRIAKEKDHIKHVVKADLHDHPHSSSSGKMACRLKSVNDDSKRVAPKLHLCRYCQGRRFATYRSLREHQAKCRVRIPPRASETTRKADSSPSCTQSVEDLSSGSACVKLAQTGDGADTGVDPCKENDETSWRMSFVRLPNGYYMCSLCRKTFLCYSGLWVHQRRHHGRMSVRNNQSMSRRTKLHNWSNSSSVPSKLPAASTATLSELQGTCGEFTFSTDEPSNEELQTEPSSDNQETGLDTGSDWRCSTNTKLSNKKRVCNICNAEFPYYTSLYRHQVREHGRKKRENATVKTETVFPADGSPKDSVVVNANSHGFYTKQTGNDNCTTTSEIGNGSVENRSDKKPRGQSPPRRNYPCNLCSKTFLHRSSVYNHQVSFHGRKKCK